MENMRQEHKHWQKMSAGNCLKEHPGVTFRRLCDKAASMGIKPVQLAGLDAAQALKHKPRKGQSSLFWILMLKKFVVWNLLQVYILESVKLNMLCQIVT